jgi:DNA-binding NarL/FixJ family response regulator
MSIRVLIADDHPIFRQGVRTLLHGAGLQVVAECGNGYEALDSALKLYPDVAVLDISMPGLNGVDTAREMMQCCPRTRVVFLTIHAEDQYIREGLLTGAKAYVLKVETGPALVTAIGEVFRGNMYLSPGVAKPIVAACRSSAELAADPLTTRERLILSLIAEGGTTAEIAERLNISAKTAEFYRTKLMDKLGIHEIANLVRYAIRLGLIEP